MIKYCITLISGLLIVTWNTTGLAALSSVFATSDECMFCHTTGGAALRDSEGNSLSIGDDWSATMMANSFRDPLFRAKVESEVARNPHLAELIEDKCLTCHTPMFRTQAVMDGADNSLALAEGSAFAGDGVSCALCHQIQDEKLGDKESFSGGYRIKNERKIFGPYKDVFPNPMLRHVDYFPLYGKQVDKPEFCASCHTLFTPFVDEKGEVAGEFPEQTPYLEWLNSTYASVDNYISCQDCHMPRIDQPVKITNRPPWYKKKQSPFWKHHFIGGNRFMLETMRDNREELALFTSTDLLNKAIERTENRLRNESASISPVENVSVDDNCLKLDVKVVNKTGHKFPTGFPSRRVWIHLTVIDAEEKILFESGSVDAQGKIINTDVVFEPHHELIDSPGQVQIYQAIMGDVEGKRTETLLKAARYLKDNRIPPKGYVRSGPMSEHTGVAGGAESDDDFNFSDGQEGSGADIVTYSIDVKNGRYPLTIKGELLYQSSNPHFIANLLGDETPAVSRFISMYEPQANRPLVVDSFSVEGVKR